MVSLAERPLIHQVIPLINQLHSRLTDLRNDKTIHMSIRHAANNAIVILNKYYSRTDECVMYCVAMSQSFIINSHVFSNTINSNAPSLQDALLHEGVLAQGVGQRSDLTHSWDLAHLLLRFDVSTFIHSYFTGYHLHINSCQGTWPLLSLPSLSLSIVPHCFSVSYRETHDTFCLL